MADNLNTLDQASTTSADIIDGSIVNADINASAAIAQSKIATLTTDLAAKIPAALVDAKGDLIVATAADTVARLAVASDNTALLAPSSGAAGGVAWSTGPTISGEFTARNLQVTGVTGAANPGRFVGVTTSGAPSTGTFAVGDFVVDQNGQIITCVVAGTPGTWVYPRDVTDLLTTGQEVINRGFATSTAVGPTASGQIRLSYFVARKSETTTQTRILSGATAAGATPTLCKIGLWSIAANGDGTLVAGTANDTALFAAINTAYTRSWAVSYAMVAGQRYAWGPLVVTGATIPSFVGQSVATAAEFAIAPLMNGTLSGIADLGNFVAASVGTSGARFYGAILP